MNVTRLWSNGSSLSLSINVNLNIYLSADSIPVIVLPVDLTDDSKLGSLKAATDLNTAEVHTTILESFYYNFQIFFVVIYDVI